MCSFLDNCQDAIGPGKCYFLRSLGGCVPFYTRMKCRRTCKLCPIGKRQSGSNENEHLLSKLLNWSKNSVTQAIKSKKSLITRIALIFFCSCLLACSLARLLARLPACLPACLLACLPACLLACLPACLPACLLACLLPRLLACLLPRLIACLLARLLAPPLARLLACLLLACSLPLFLKSGSIGIDHILINSFRVHWSWLEKTSQGAQPYI